MSVTVMSLVFAYNMPNLKTDDGTTVPDSTAKFILLALADHCNDDGEAAYPSLSTLCLKTSMSRGTVCNAVNALKTNGFTTYEGESKRHTSNYSIIIDKLRASPTTEPVRPPNFAKSNHRTLDGSTTEHESSIKPSIKPPAERPKLFVPGIEGSIGMGRPTVQEDLDTPEMVARRELQTFIEAMKLNPNLDAPEWERFGRFLREQRLSGKPQEKYTAWFRSDAFRYKNIGSWSPDGIKGRYSFKVTWPQAFEVNQPIRATGEHLL